MFSPFCLTGSESVRSIICDYYFTIYLQVFLCYDKEYLFLA